MSALNRLYKAARALFDSDEEFKDRARTRVVALQAGDPETLALWQQFVDESKIYFYSVFDKLDMEIRDADDRRRVRLQRHARGDLPSSWRSPASRCAREGALCVFFDDIKGPDGNPVPLIVQKSRRRLRLRGHRPRPRSATGSTTSRRTRCSTWWTPGSRCTSRWSSRRPAGPAG